MLRFNIDPFVGALPVRFGMRRSDVHDLLGMPEASNPVWDGSGMTDYWNQSSVSVGYGNDEIVNHLGFCPRGCELSLFGNALWRAGYYTDPNETFLRYDPDPLERLGFLVFPRIGVTTTGFHDNDENQRALTVFPAGTWDEWLKTASKPDLSKYGKKGA